MAQSSHHDTRSFSSRMSRLVQSPGSPTLKSNASLHLSKENIAQYAAPVDSENSLLYPEVEHPPPTLSRSSKRLSGIYAASQAQTSPKGSQSDLDHATIVSSRFSQSSFEPALLTSRIYTLDLDQSSDLDPPNTRKSSCNIGYQRSTSNLSNEIDPSEVTPVQSKRPPLLRSKSYTPLTYSMNSRTALRSLMSSLREISPSLAFPIPRYCATLWMSIVLEWAENLPQNRDGHLGLSEVMINRLNEVGGSLISDLSAKLKESEAIRAGSRNDNVRPKSRGRSSRGSSGGLFSGFRTSSELLTGISTRPGSGANFDERNHGPSPLQRRSSVFSVLSWSDSIVSEKSLSQENPRGSNSSLAGGMRDPQSPMLSSRRKSVRFDEPNLLSFAGRTSPQVREKNSQIEMQGIDWSKVMFDAEAHVTTRLQDPSPRLRKIPSNPGGVDDMRQVIDLFAEVVLRRSEAEGGGYDVLVSGTREVCLIENPQCSQI